MKLPILLVNIIFLYGCVAPPVTKNKDQPNDQPDPNGLENYMEYHRYLQEVVNALESDPEFKSKLEKASEEDIRSGKIAHELEFVGHHVRTQLDELKRTELARLRELVEQKDLLEHNSIDEPAHHHLDPSNPHTFEIEDLKKLIAKTTEDLAEADRKRRDEFKEYEMQKEFERQEKLNHTAGDERAKLEKEYKEMEEKHKNHGKLHEPGHKKQLEEVWEEQDHMQQEFNPKAFFMLHDLDSNGLWDETEVKALFIKELDKMYATGAPEDDMRERAEEMERMREAVFKEVDTNKDGFIDYKEFIAQTRRNDFQQDHGWKGLDEQQQYTDEEMEQYIRHQQAQQAYYQQQMPPPGMGHPGQMHQQGMAHPGQMPPPGMAHPGQMQQQGMAHPGQMPPQGMAHPGQVPSQGMAHPGQMPPQGKAYPGQVPPGYYNPPHANQVPPGGYQANVGGGEVSAQAQVQSGQQIQQPHINAAQNIHNQQGNMPDLNTNEIYQNPAQQNQYQGQQAANQGNQIPPQRENVSQQQHRQQQQQQPVIQNQPIQQQNINNPNMHNGVQTQQ